MAGVIVGLGGPLRGTTLSALVREALALGYTEFDTSDAYPRFGQVGPALAGVSRASFRLTSKVDVTLAHRRALCASDGSGCADVVLHAVTAQLQKLQLGRIDTMLLHRPPTCARTERDSHGRCDAAVQCARAREQWRGLEAAARAGHVGAIGLSNYCPALLQCVLRVAERVPDVLQQMHHVGMGTDPMGHIGFARALGIQYVAYSVLGGVSGQTAAILSAAGSARSAIAWVRQQAIPVVVLATKRTHLAENARLLNASNRHLPVEQAARLSAVRFGPQGPSHWGDCHDDPSSALDSKSARLMRAMARFARERCHAPHAPAPVMASMATERECAAVARARRMLFDVALGATSRERTVPWAPLEGVALATHDDPLGALFAGDVPAIVIRKLVRPKALEHMLRRIAQRAADQRDGGNGRVGCLFCLLNASRISRDPRCATRLRGCVWGQKLAASIAEPHGAAEMRTLHAERCAPMTRDLASLDAHCPVGTECTPHTAVLRALTDVGAGRRARIGAELDVAHNPIVAAMAPGFAYPLHYDSAQANAWPPLREWACGERVPRLLARPDAVTAFRVLKDHAHMGAAIFTLQAPDRTVGGRNPHDVRIFRARWTDYALDCAMRSGPNGGMYQRVAKWNRSDTPYVDIRANPGDFYLFNTEFVHITPHIRGSVPRIVLSGVVGYSSERDSWMELYG
jgi:diketogulonate reductase-like aldo/keto reductase